MAAVVAALTLLLAVAAWRLTGGPVHLSFLTPYVQDALRETDSPYRVEFADTILTWAGWERTLDIRLLDVRMVGVDGALAASAPEISLGLSVPAMFRGMIAPTSLEIIEPSVWVVRAADGHFEIGLGKADGAKGGVRSNASELLFADLLAPPDPTRAMGYLDRVSIVGGELVIDDRQLDVSWYAPHATVDFTRNAAGIGAVALLDIEISGHTATIEASGRYGSADGETRLRLDFANIRPEWLAQKVPRLARLAAARLPVSGSLDATFDSGGAAARILFDLRAGAGSLRLETLFDHDIDIVSARAKGAIAPGSELVRIDKAFIDLGGPKIDLTVSLEGFDDTPSIVGGVTISDLPVDDLDHYWPPKIGPVSRKWVVTNLTDGMIRKVKASVRIGPDDLKGGALPDEAIVTQLDLEGVTVNYRDPLPKVFGVDGQATITGRKLEIATRGGTIEGMQLGPGSIVISDLGGTEFTAIDLRLQGPITNAMTVMAHPYLGYTQSLGIDPASVGGSFAARLHFDFPLNIEVHFDDVTVGATAELRGASIANAFDGYMLSGGDFALTLDGKGMDLTGQAALNGVPANVSWRRNFTPGAAVENRYRVEGRFNDSQRHALGLPGNDYVAGPTDIEIEVADRAGRRRFDVTAGFDEAMLRIPPLHWEKKAGIAGALRLEGTQSADAGFVVDGFELTTPDLAASGRAAFSPGDNALQRLDLVRLDMGDTSIQAAVTPLDGGGYKIDLAGAGFDLRPYLDEALRGDGDTGPPLELSAQLDRVLLDGDRPLTGVTAQLSLKDGRWERVVVDGGLSGDKRLALRIARSGDARVLWLGSDDAGTVLRSFGIFDNVIGGTLALSATLDSGESGEASIGQLRIADFKLRHAPLLAKIVSVASLTGAFDLLKGEGLPFTRLVFPFTKHADKLTIRDGRAYGPAIGFTIKGDVNLADDTVGLDGTLVPAYRLNSVFGKLPILGKILVGPKGGGLFAATYRAVGPLDNPKITVNPLAALAPGVLRGVFSFTGEDAGEVEPFEPAIPDSSR